MVKQLVFLPVAILLSLTGALLAAPALAQQPPAIEGTVVNGTTNAAAPGAHVALEAMRADGPAQIAETVADEQGRFSFARPSGTAIDRYIVTTRYLDVDYSSPSFDTQGGPVRVSVFETTPSDESIGILRASMAVPSIDTETGLIQVLEVVTYANRGNRTYVGGMGSDPGRGGVLKVTLPPDALDLTLGDGFGADPVQTQEGFLTRSPMPPGESTLVYAYKVPFTSRTYTLERTFPYPVDRATFLISTQWPGPSSDQLTTVETVDINGAKNFSLSARGLAAGQRIGVTLSGLPPLKPPSAAGGGVDLDTALRGLGVGVMAVLAAALAVTFWRSRRAPRPAPAPIEDPLEAEQGALASALADLDEAFEAGRVAGSDYRSARTLQKQRLLDVMLLIRERSGGAAP